MSERDSLLGGSKRQADGLEEARDGGENASTNEHVQSDRRSYVIAAGVLISILVIIVLIVSDGFGGSSGSFTSLFDQTHSSPAAVDSGYDSVMAFSETHDAKTVTDDFASVLDYVVKKTSTVSNGISITSSNDGKVVIAGDKVTFHRSSFSFKKKSIIQHHSI
jgi:hypothetical protein